MNFKTFLWCVLLKFVLCEENTVTSKLQDVDGTVNSTLEFKTTALFLKLNASYQESTTLASRIEKKNETKVVLEYKPTRPSFLPEPSTVQQLIPPGKPWPASPEDYINKNNETKLVLEPITLANKIENNVVLEYKPTRPSFLPEPSTVQQLIPPGKPWPASPDDYVTENNKTQVLESITLTNRIEKKNETGIILEYKPTRPSFLPEPSTVQQLIPPGKPWPASPEEQVTKSTLSPHLINRFPELTSTSTSTRPATFSTRIVLTYKPQRPWYLPEPTIIQQIIPPGKPWPASLEEYVTFSQTTYRPNRFEKQKSVAYDKDVK